MKKRIIHGTTFLAIGLIVFSATNCTKEKTPINLGNPDCADTISFSNQILPMIQANCIGCHDAGGTSPTLTNHAQISANASQIYGTLTGQPVLMPQGGPALNDSLIKQMSCWIAQGKMNN